MQKKRLQSRNDLVALGVGKDCADELVQRGGPYRSVNAAEWAFTHKEVKGFKATLDMCLQPHANLSWKEVETLLHDLGIDMPKVELRGLPSFLSCARTALKSKESR